MTRLARLQDDPYWVQYGLTSALVVDGQMALLLYYEDSGLGEDVHEDGSPTGEPVVLPAAWYVVFPDDPRSSVCVEAPTFAELDLGALGEVERMAAIVEVWDAAQEAASRYAHEARGLIGR